MCQTVHILTSPISYNASVFQVKTGNEYGITLIEYNSPDWLTLNTTVAKVANRTIPDAGVAANLSNRALRTAYGTEYVSEHGDVILAVEKLAYEYDLSSLNETGDLQRSTLRLPSQVRYSASHNWSLGIDDRGWVPALLLDENWAQNITPTEAALSLLVHGGFAYPGVRNCKILLNLPFIIVVTMSNAFKVAVLIYMLLDETSESPLVTIGDAIASFLSDPDPSTVGHCNLSRDEFGWITYHKRLGYGGRASDFDRRNGIWKPRTRHYGSALPIHKSLFTAYM